MSCYFIFLFFNQKNSSSYFCPSHFQLVTFLPNPKQSRSKICLQWHSSINFINVLFPANTVTDILFPWAESLPPYSKDVSDNIFNCWIIMKWYIYFSELEVDPHLDVDRLTLFPLYPTWPFLMPVLMWFSQAFCLDSKTAPLMHHAFRENLSHTLRLALSSAFFLQHG